MSVDRAACTAERDRLRAQYLTEAKSRPSSIAHGVHHVALMCTDVERTIRFYQELIGLPLVEIFENRDYEGSTHLFFDLGHGNSLAFFYAEVIGGLHHIAISVEQEQWDAARQHLEGAGVPVHIDSGVSMYFSDPDGVRLELIAEQLGSLYGTPLH